MTGSLLKASLRIVAQPAHLVPAGVAVVMTVAAVAWLDPGYASLVRLGVATLLACSLAVTAEDPAGEVAAASPYRPWVRCATRLVVGLAVVLPIGVLALVLLAHQGDAVSTRSSAIQMLAIVLSGPAFGFAVWAWGDSTQPSHAAAAGVVCWSLAMWKLPTTWAVISAQPWGPPWEAIQIRWGALILLAVAIMANAWHDPLAKVESKKSPIEWALDRRTPHVRAKSPGTTITTASLGKPTARHPS